MADALVSSASCARSPRSRPCQLYLCVVLASVVMITGTVGYLQERKSNALMDSFQKMMPSEVVVRRGGEESKQSPANLVVGDIVLLKVRVALQLIG